MNERLNSRASWLPLLVLVLLSGWLPPAAVEAADEVNATAEQRTRVEVTVYNQDLALVREIRSLELPAGRFRLEFADVPARINPVTLLVESSDRNGFEVLEQNYEFDLMSKEKLLQKYVGHDLAWLQEDGSMINGTLLSMTGGPVFRVDEQVVFEVPGRLALPQLPATLRARPTLVWEARTEDSGRHELDVSYLTGGMSWQADYVLQLDAAGARAGLQAWVTVNNRSGAAYLDASLLLIAGDLHRVSAAPEVMMDAVQYSAPARGPAFSEQTLYDYHLYTLQRSTDLADNQIKQISLFEASDLRIAKKYSLRSSPRIFRGAGMPAGPEKVSVSYLFDNTEDNGLGVPLPAGTFRVYGRADGGSRQLLGEDRIDHTPRDEQIQLQVGKAFDIVAERVRTESKRVADNLYRSTFAITLRNHRDENVTVDVHEAVGGFWEVLHSTHEFRRISAEELVFPLAVPADGETTLTYAVEVKY